MLRIPRLAAADAVRPAGHDAARLAGRARTGRGTLAAVIAVGTAAVAHAAAHQAPAATTVLLALLISLPICIALADVRLSRIRLALSVGLSQALLHGMFVLPTASAAGAAPHAAGGMLPAHGLAALGTYLLLRRGEVLLAALVELVDLLTLRPARILMGASGGLRSAAPRVSIPRTSRRPVLARVDVEPGTVRGPPPHPPTTT